MKIEKRRGAGVFDPPGYHHLMKVTGMEGILFTAGQVPFDADGNVSHPPAMSSSARKGPPRRWSR